MEGKENEHNENYKKSCGISSRYRFCHGLTKILVCLHESSLFYFL